MAYHCILYSLQSEEGREDHLGEAEELKQSSFFLHELGTTIVPKINTSSL
jgi:hypothetical protein